MPDADAPLTIGQAEGFYTDGLIDEVEIFHRALSADEIEAIVLADTSGKCKPDSVSCTLAAGNALQFDGSDYVEIPHSESLSLPDGSSGTIEFWLKPTALPSVYHVLGKRDGCISTGINYQVGGDVANGFQGGRGDCGVKYGPDPQPPLNQWTHFAITFSSTECRLYANGALIDVQPSSGSSTNPNTFPLRLGTSGSCMGMQGLLDEVRMWNVTRTPEEIAANYDKTVDPSTNGLVGYWNFDEALGDQNVLDLSGTGNNGLLGGDAGPSGADPIRVPSSAPVFSCETSVVQVEPRTISGRLLGTPYPNPAFGTTSFYLSLPRALNVRVSVFDVRGTRVSTVVDGFLPAGRYNYRWAGVDAAGKKVAPGIYFIHIRAGGLRDTRRIVLLR